MALLQRLFTTFAGGWPGLGLLIQRFAIGVALIAGTVHLSGSTTVGVIVLESFAGLLAVFLLIGLWTPVAGVLIAAMEIWIVLLYPGGSLTAILITVFCITVAMIGPGAFSLDARLFGRKQIST